MPQFTDSKGRSWSIEITVGALKRVRRLLAVDLMDVLEAQKGLLESLYRDPVAIADVCYAACQPQAESLGVDQDEFLGSLSGDAIDHARDALLEGLAAFFPSPPTRAAMRRVIDEAKRQQQIVRESIERRIESGDLERAMDAELDRLGISSGRPPASSASNPTG